MQNTETPRNYQLALLGRGLFREISTGGSERRRNEERQDGRGKMGEVGITMSLGEEGEMTEGYVGENF